MQTGRCLFGLFDQLEGLEAAIVIERRAVELTLDGHPKKPLWLINIGNPPQDRLQRVGTSARALSISTRSPTATAALGSSRMFMMTPNDTTTYSPDPAIDRHRELSIQRSARPFTVRVTRMRWRFEEFLRLKRFSTPFPTIK